MTAAAISKRYEQPELGRWKESGSESDTERVREGGGEKARSRAEGERLRGRDGRGVVYISRLLSRPCGQAANTATGERTSCSLPVCSAGPGSVNTSLRPSSPPPPPLPLLLSLIIICRYSDALRAARVAAGHWAGGEGVCLLEGWGGGGSGWRRRGVVAERGRQSAQMRAFSFKDNFSELLLRKALSKRAYMDLYFCLADVSGSAPNVSPSTFPSRCR